MTDMEGSAFETYQAALRSAVKAYREAEISAWEAYQEARKAQHNDSLPDLSINALTAQAKKRCDKGFDKPRTSVL